MHVYTDKDRNRDGHTDCKCTPRAVVQSVHDNDGHAGHGQDVEKEHGKGCNQADIAAHLAFCDFGNGLAVIPHGCKKNDHIVDAAGQYAAENNPQCAR